MCGIPLALVVPTESLRAIKLAVAGAEDLLWEQAREVESSAFKGTWGSPDNLHALETAVKKTSAGRRPKA